MKILFVSLPVPWPLDSGGRLRRYHIVRELARRHSVTLATLLPREPTDPPGPTPLHEICHRVIETDVYASVRRSAPKGKWVRRCELAEEALLSARPRALAFWSTAAPAELLRSIYDSDRFDAVWVDRSQVGVAAERARIPRVVVDLDDLGTHWLYRSIRHDGWRAKKVLDLIDLPKTYLFERGLTRRFWRCVVCKEDDRAFWGSRAQSVFVVPNGVDTFPPSPPTPNSKELLFVGAMESEPNVDAVRWFCRDVFSRCVASVEGVRFSIVGRSPTAEVQALHDGQQIVVQGAVSDLGPYYNRAAVVIAPIRLGSGTRLKVLEALGRAKAVVCTTVAAEGLNLRPGVDLLIADTPAEFSRACELLLRDPDARTRIGSSGRTRVYEQYNWGAVGQCAERVLTG